MNRPFQLFLLKHFNPENRFKMLNAYRLHVLSTAAEDVSGFVFVGCKRIVSPELVSDGHNVGVGIKQKRGKVGLRSDPGHNDCRLARNNLDNFVAQIELLGVCG